MRAENGLSAERAASLDQEAERLNRNCACESQGAGSMSAFYANAPVFISANHRRLIDESIAAILRVAALPAFESAALSGAPPIASHMPRTLGVFTAFDFHVAEQGPKLIEINTNAGGAMLNAVAEWRHPECCDDSDPGIRLPAPRSRLEQDFIAMFREEWRLARGDAPLRTIAIVDDQPERQFLYPEFQLFSQLFAAHGFHAVIVDARELRFDQGRLFAGAQAIDLVYNRLTDFCLDDPAHAALRGAYLSDAAVITPHPRAHALLADKRNLVRFTDETFLRSMGATGEDIQRMQVSVPETRRVDGQEQEWWRDRKQWFFKPEAGFASRGAYRGDKITRRAFGEVMQGGYVAQEFAAPGERLRRAPSGPQMFKVDLRCYVYAGVVQLIAARLYQGQTTNFRTAGGGFAPVIELRDAMTP